MKRTKLSLLFLSAMLLTGCRTTDPKDPNIASVYESYKSNGGTLDYNTWLDSIKGKDGTNGKDGVNGKDGKDGTSILTGEGAPLDKNGKDGDVYIDTASFDFYSKKDGKWVKTGNIKGDKGDKGDTGATGLQGEKGDKGDTGATGPQGEKGDKGDTGATGPQGEKGDKGDTGATGSQGEKGDKGDTGATGPQGEKGDKGDTGATGLQGEKGDKGDTGATGPQGDKGDKGDTGATGPQGEKGDKGDTGATGPQGEKGDKGDPGQDAITYVPAIFNNYDGTKLYEFYYEKGSDIVYDGPTPTRVEKDSSGNAIEYTFIGWDKSLKNIQKPTIFTAQFKKIATYDVTFLNYDDSVLYKTSLPLGSTPKYVGSVPTKASTESGDVRTDWEFAGWDKELAPVTGDTVYKAQFNSIETYKCTFTNEDGTVLGTSYCKNGGTATYFGKEPKKDSVNNNGVVTVYTFTDWDKQVTNIKAPTTFVAQYEESTAYECKFVNDDGSLLYSTIAPQGGKAMYLGERPFKEGIVNGTSITKYKFNGWDNALTNIYKPTTFKAQYTEEQITGYKVTFTNSDGTEICHDYVSTGKSAVYPKNYNKFKWTYDSNSVTRFAGWDKDLTNVTSETTFKAKYITITRHQNGEFAQTLVDDEALHNALLKTTAKDETGNYVVYRGERYEQRMVWIGFDENYDDIYAPRFYKVEPIRWRYLSQEGKKVQYRSENILCEREWKNTDTQTSGQKLNNYKESDIRKWLNGEFLNKAFYYDRALIVPTDVDNSVSSTMDYSNSNICSNTKDRVYLLSKKDIYNENYGFVDDESRLAYYNDEVDYWWTRSPDAGAKAIGVYGVSHSGTATTGMNCANERGIRPALTFQFEA